MYRHERNSVRSRIRSAKSCVNRPSPSLQILEKTVQNNGDLMFQTAMLASGSERLASAGRKSDGGASKSSCHLCPFLFRFRSIFAPFNYTITFVPNYTALACPCPLPHPTLHPLRTHCSPRALSPRRVVWQLVLKREHRAPSFLLYRVSQG